MHPASWRSLSWTDPLVPLVSLALSVLLVASTAVRAAGPAQAPTADGVTRSRWWAGIEAADALIRDGQWRKAHKRVEQTIDQTIRRGWQAPDLGRVLAAESLQRAVLALHRGETETALWHWDEARNLDPAVAERLAAYGDLVAPLRDHPLRTLGRLPDGTEPPPRFATPGYRPVQVQKVPSVGLFENAWARQLGSLPSVTVEVVVGPDGAFRDPVVTREGFPPALAYWTMERIRQADLEVVPARLDGEPIADLTTIEMAFETSTRW